MAETTNYPNSQPVQSEKVKSMKKRKFKVKEESRCNLINSVVKRNLVVSLRDIFKCPTCFETISIPFKMCRTGHIVCCTCISRLKLRKCPLCQKNFVVKSLETIKKIIELIPVKCPYDAFGCRVVYNNNDRTHESVCPFRLFSCRDCPSVLPINKLNDHYKDRHPERFVIRNESASVCWWVNIVDIQVQDCPAIIFEHVFWVMLINYTKEKYIKMFFHVHPIGESKKEFYLLIDFYKSGYTFSREVKACFLNHWENGVVERPESEAIPEECCVILPHAVVKMFLDDDQGELHTHLSFLKRD